MSDVPNPTNRPVESSTARQPPSVVVLTFNEEGNVAQCIERLGFTDDIVVLDSYSTDRTVEIAKSFPNVRVFQRTFDTEYKQRNYALHEIEYRHDWVYICDADERVPDDLAAELMRVANDASRAHVAYRLRYKNMYMGRWIKHASSYPVWIIRLVRPRRVTYEKRETNVHPIVDGTVGELECHFVHHSFNSGLVRWFAKHNYYSTREAMEGVRIRRQGRPRLSRLKSGDSMVRRRAMKNFSYFLVGRAWFRFLHMYLVKLGFLDGVAGFNYCAMIAMYEYWIEVKISELESNWRRATDRKVARLLAEPVA